MPVWVAEVPVGNGQHHRVGMSDPSGVTLLDSHASDEEATLVHVPSNPQNEVATVVHLPSGLSNERASIAQIATNVPKERPAASQGASSLPNEQPAISHIASSSENRYRPAVAYTYYCPNRGWLRNMCYLPDKSSLGRNSRLTSGWSVYSDDVLNTNIILGIENAMRGGQQGGQRLGTGGRGALPAPNQGQMVPYNNQSCRHQQGQGQMVQYQQQGQMVPNQQYGHTLQIPPFQIGQSAFVWAPPYQYHC
ncbi:hypothetical protein F5Y16DRAFT_388745 [Xylariaceae sp. FL0255]|nr:hypothetical protein F5Y16DRAFT_388745 [Xylariaceae sp. FL0255]